MYAVAEELDLDFARVLLPETTDSEWFERTLLDRSGFQSSVGFPSARTAISWALRNAGVDPDDEVLIPGYTCHAVDQAVKTVATPVYVDVSIPAYGLDLEDARRQVTDRTAAIVPIHAYGIPCDMEAVAVFGDEHDLTVIEDAAQALGTTYTSDSVCRHGDACVFSLRFSKEVTSFRGGLLLTDDPPDSVPSPGGTRRRLAKLLAVRTFDGVLRRLPGSVYEPVRARLLDPLFRSTAASVGDVRPRGLSDHERRLLGDQYRRLEARVQRRRTRAERYREALPGAFVLPPDDGNAYFRFPVLVPAPIRDRFASTLRRRGVGCSTTYSYTLSPPGTCPRAEFVAERMVTLPLPDGPDNTRFERAVRTVAEAWADVAEAADVTEVRPPAPARP